ncbi:MAG: hypothetical protein IJ071_09555 [Ruminococcus sp.]|nr:hypothetical protein [Ruminococcus sp.]
MNKFIYTQTDEVLNLGCVVRITPVEIEAENTVSGEEVTAYAINALTVNDEEIQLGIYETEEELFTVMEEIKKWISSNAFSLFIVPVTVTPD